MYKGNHTHKTKYRKSIVMLASIAVILCAAVGGTLAWLVAKSGPVTNTFTPGEVSCKVGETVSGNTKSNVYVENTGNVNAYLRAWIVVSWKNDAGQVYGTPPVKGENGDYTITPPGGAWGEKDGFYYYKSPVAPGGKAEGLIGSCTLNNGANVPEGYHLSVEIVADAIQSQPDSAVQAAWGFVPGGGMTMRKILSLFLALLLVLSLSATAFADEIGLVEYRSKGFSFLPGYREAQLRYPTDIFPNLKNVMPGDTVSQQIKIVHKASRDVNIVVYLRADGSDQNADFIRQMQLEVLHKGGNILYDDFDATEKTGWKRLATLAPGKSATLDLQLTVPLEMTSEFADTLGTVVWQFKVEEIPIDPDTPKTGDAITPWALTLALSAIALAVLGFRKRKDYR